MTNPPLSSSAKAKIRMAVNRIAVGAASNNGDPILADTTILSETTVNLSPKPAQELDTDDCVAVDGSGGRYFTHVRSDGRGQINIRWPNGIEKTLKFWVPEAYVQTSFVDLTRDDLPNSPIASTAIEPEIDLDLEAVETPPNHADEIESSVITTADLLRGTAKLLSRHPLVFALLGFAIAFDLYKIFGSDTLDESYALGSSIAVLYFLGIASLVRFAFSSRGFGVALAFMLSMILYFGWVCLSLLISEDHLQVSWLLAACLIAAYTTFSYEANRV